MSNHGDGQHDKQITKADSHEHGAHTSNFQQEVQAHWNNAGNAVRHAVQDVQHIDFSDPFKKAGAAVEHAWNALDNDKNGHFFKHDICNDNPVLAGVAGVAVVGVGTIGAIVAAPEAVAAAGIGAGTAGALSYAGVFSTAALAMNYDRTHQK